MRHLRDDELVLQYYGESGRRAVDVERHLRSCAQCARLYEALSRSLDAVAAPAFGELIDAAQFVRQALRQLPPERRDARFITNQILIAAGEWAVALLYPVSLRVLFASAHWGRSEAARVVTIALALLWACGGPIIAAVALERAWRAGTGKRVVTKFVVVGAVVSATAPALFLFARVAGAHLATGLDPWSWYGLLGIGALSALVPWPTLAQSTRRLVGWHRVTALGLMAFLFGHVINQALGFLSPSWYVAMRSVLRLASLNPISYTAIVAAVSMQVVTGAVASTQNIGPGAFRRNLQTTSGWYLAAFFLMHVFPGLMFASPVPATTVAIRVNSFNLLASARGISQLPFLLLGVAAFLFHVGVYARVVALAYLAETSVRRLSYAGALAAGVVVVSVGLSLCGVHL